MCNMGHLFVQREDFVVFRTQEQTPCSKVTAASTLHITSSTNLTRLHIHALRMFTHTSS
eukprot:m.391047 g.391047  ORF g.391047 m.391047 type:complete len:59 (+) comp212135_c0_seq1:151-327(+)